MQLNLKKITLRFTYFSSAVFLLLFFFGLAYFTQKTRTYQSQAYLLLLPRNQKTASQINIITHNLERTFNQFLFYQKNNLLAKNNSSAVLQAEVLPQSSFIKIQVSANNSKDSLKIKQEALDLFLDKIAFYYDIRDDLDVRIIKNENFSRQVNNFYLSIGLSFGGALLLWFLGQVIYLVYIDLEKKYFSVWRNKRDWQPLKNISSKNYSTKKDNKFTKEKKLTKLVPNFQAKTKKEEKEKNEKTIVTKKASAPSNLPVLEKNEKINNSQAPSNLPIVEMENREKSESIQKSETNNSSTSEPTEEEYKERLNQLLRGEL